MKRSIAWWLAISLCLLLGIWLLSNNAGYVLVVRKPYRIQFSFNFSLLLMVCGFFVIHYALRFILFLRKLPANQRRKQAEEHLKLSNAALLEGMHALAIHDLEAARKAAERARALGGGDDLDKLIATINNPQQTLKL